METKQQTLFSKLNEMLRPYEKLPVMTHDPEFLQRQNDLYGKLWENVKTNLTNHIAGQDETAETFVKQKLADYKVEATEFPSDSSQILDLMKLYYKVIAFSSFPRKHPSSMRTASPQLRKTFWETRLTYIRTRSAPSLTTSFRLPSPTVSCTSCPTSSLQIPCKI